MHKWILFLLFIYYSQCYGQYKKNDTRDFELFQLVQKDNKNLYQIFYNRIENLNENYRIEHSVYIESKSKDYRLIKADSISIYEYLKKNDSTIFNGDELVKMVKSKKMIAFDYSNPQKIYTAKNIDSLRFLINNICLEFPNSCGNQIIFRNADSTETIQTVDLESDLSKIHYFEPILEIHKENNKITSIKTKGVIIYFALYNGTTTDFLGLAGLCCFIYKKTKTGARLP